MPFQHFPKENLIFKIARISIQSIGRCGIESMILLSPGSPMVAGLWAIRVHTAPGILTLVWFGLDRARHENSVIRTHLYGWVPVGRKNTLAALRQ